MAGQAIWDDFDNFCEVYLPRQTIAKLRQFSNEIHLHAGMNLGLKSQERKADLVDKVKAAFITMKRNNQAALYIKVRRECEQLAAQSYRGHSVTLPAPTFGAVPSSSSFNSTAPSRAPPPRSPFTASMPSVPRSGWQQASSSAVTHQHRPPALVDWKQSPMWKPQRALTHMEQLPDIATNESSHTRREKRVTFNLSDEMIKLLNKTKAEPRSRPQYSVRLFCTSSEHYRPPGMAPQVGIPPPNNRMVPIEFPNNPDAWLDERSVPFKERGLRGKAGSAPPLDLDKGSHGLVRIAGRVMSVKMGHSGPTLSKNKNVAKKFYFQIVFCEVTSMEDVLARLEVLVPTDAAAELERMRKRAEDDDDIEVGPSTLSLKDPLSGMRITKPIRSTKCSHLQCFDARWWMESNKTHPQWNCPHCSKELKIDDIICDGYFFSVLRTVPDSIDEVILESNGEWHTPDNRYHSAGWVPPPAPTSVPTTAVSTPGFSTKRERSPTPDLATGKRRAIEVLSDSSDEGERSRPNGGAYRSAQLSAAPGSRASSSLGITPAVIDLTLSSDEEDEGDPPLHFRQPGGGTTRPGGAASDPRPAESTAAQSSSFHPTLAIQQPQPHPQPQPQPSRPIPGDSYRPSRGETSSPFSAQLLAGLDQVASGSTSNARANAPLHSPSLPPKVSPGFPNHLPNPDQLPKPPTGHNNPHLPPRPITTLPPRPTMPPPRRPENGH